MCFKNRIEMASVGKANGWRIAAIIYAVIFLIFNSIASLSCKEIKEDHDVIANKKSSTENVSFFTLLKAVFTNKYYLLLLGVYLFMYTNTNLATDTGSTQYDKIHIWCNSPDSDCTDYSMSYIYEG